MSFKSTHGIKDLAYWQQNVFINIITYSLPISLFAVVPSIIVTYLDGNNFIPVCDIIALISIAFITLNRRINIAFKKAFALVVLHFLAVVLMAALGSFGIGSIYLLALSVYISLLFSPRVAYSSIAVNALTYLAFTTIIYFKLFNTPLQSYYNTSYWIVYSLNFLFLNMAVVITICHIINGLKNTIVKEALLISQLRAQFEEKKERNQILRESEEHYKSLFLLNPSPMFIFEQKTLRILQVNETAISKYEYSQEEFLNMTLKDLRPPHEADQMSNVIEENIQSQGVCQHIIQHQRRSGEIVYVEVRCSAIPFKGKEARLAICRNITSQMRYTQAIEKQNAQLKEIAFIQSHVVRAPLARLMAITDLIIDNACHQPDPQLLNYLDKSAKELDEVIKTIVQHSEETFPITNHNILLDE